MHDPTVLHVEGRAVPGTLYALPLYHLALQQRSAHVRAHPAQRQDLASLLQQRQRQLRTLDLDLALRELAATCQPSDSGSQALRSTDVPWVKTSSPPR